MDLDKSSVESTVVVNMVNTAEGGKQTDTVFKETCLYTHDNANMCVRSNQSSFTSSNDRPRNLCKTPFVCH